MRLSRPRFTILTLMIVVVIASLVLTAFMVYQRRRNLLFAIQSAAADYANTKLTREVAEIIVLEYSEGIYKHDLDTLNGELGLAESDLKRARDSSASVDRAELRVERAKERLILLQQTKSKTLNELQSEVANAKANELAKKATLDQLKAAFEKQWW